MKTIQIDGKRVKIQIVRQFLKHRHRYAPIPDDLSYVTLY